MKILHVSDVFIKHGGGAPNVIFELAKEQIKLGHEVAVATFKYQDDWEDYEVVEGIEIFRTPFKSGILPFYFSGHQNMKKLASTIGERFSPDLLHIHMPFSGRAVSSVLKDSKVVYTFHGSWPEEYRQEAQGLKRKTGLYLLEIMKMKSIERAILKKAKKIVTLSQFMQSAAKQYALSPKHGWQIIPSGVDLERFQVLSEEDRVQFREKVQIPKDAFFIFTSRRLARRMGLEQLLEAVKKLVSEVENLYLVIGGKGELKEELEIMIQDYNLENHVRLEGFIDDEVFPKYFGASDLFVLPTQALEGFGLVNLESLATGTPVIGTPIGAIPEVIGPFDESLVLPSSRSKDIAEGIKMFHDKYILTEDKKIRKDAREYAEEFSWEKMAKSYELVYFGVE